MLTSPGFQLPSAEENMRNLPGVTSTPKREAHAKTGGQFREVPERLLEYFDESTRKWHPAVHYEDI